MVKMVICVRRNPELSAEEFRAYWRDHHGPLVAEHAKALRIRRYVQSVTLDDWANSLVRRRRGTLEPFDGIAELWWDSLADLYKGGLSPSGIRADGILLADEKRFVDHLRTVVFFTEEHEVFDRTE